MSTKVDHRTVRYGARSRFALGGALLLLLAAGASALPYSLYIRPTPTDGSQGTIQQPVVIENQADYLNPAKIPHVVSNAVVVIEAVAKPGYEFLRWEWQSAPPAGALIAEVSNSLTLLEYDGGSAVRVQAVFRRPDVTLTVISTNDVAGTIGNPVPGTSTHPYNTVINASVTSPSVYGVNSDSRGICQGYIRSGSSPAINLGGDTATTFTLTTNTTLRWVWAIERKLTFSAAGVGTVTALPVRTGNWYANGENMTLTATPGAGQSFVGWTGDVPAGSLTVNPLTLPMDRPRNIVGHFAAPGDKVLTVTSRHPVTGNVIGNPRLNGVSYEGTSARPFNELLRIQVDDSQTVNAAATERVVNPRFTGTGSAPATGGSDTGVFPIQFDTTVTFNWDRQYLLELEVVGDGAVERTPGGTPSVDGRGYWYDRGQVVRLRAIDAGLQTFLRWGGDLGGVSRTNSITMNAGAVVQAIFGQAQTDSDGDGLPDNWEETYGLDPDSPTGDHGWTGDPDNDGLGNGQEYLISMTWSNAAFRASPIDADSDGDEMDDGYEFYHMLNLDGGTNAIPGDQQNGRAVVTATGTYGRNGNPDQDFLWDTLSGYETEVGLRNIDEYIGPDEVRPASWPAVMWGTVRQPVRRLVPNPLDSGDQSYSDVTDSEIVGGAVQGDGFDDGFEFSWDQWQRRHAGDPVGDPLGHFVPEPFGNAADPRSIAVGDFNNDGNLDCAVANRGRDEVVVFLGDGSGIFAAGSQIIQVGSQPSMVLAADVDGDNDLDLVTANSGANSVSISTNVAGVFQAAVAKTFGVPGPGVEKAVAVAVAEFTGDARVDIAVVHKGLNSVYILDGALDYGVAQTIAVGAAPHYLDAGAIWGAANRVGPADLVVANSGSDTFSVLQNNAGTLTRVLDVPTGIGPVCVLLGDYDEDGTNDVAVLNRDDDDLRSYKGDGAGAFPSASTSGTGVLPVHMALGQLNSVSPFPNQDEDLAICNWSNRTLSIRLGDNVDASFTQGPTIDLDAPPAWVAVGDFNNDGLDDLLVALPDLDAIQVLFGRGNGNFTRGSLFPATVVTVDRRFNPGRIHPAPPDNGRADYDIRYDPDTGAAGDWWTDEMEYNAWQGTNGVLRREFPTRRRSTHPFLWDPDGDKMPDGWEVTFRYDPWDADTDDDGQDDGEENPDGDWFAQIGNGPNAIKHHDVYLATNFDPRTGWGYAAPLAGGGPNTAQFSNYEELVGTNGIPATVARDPRDAATHPLRNDTDHDGIWDGWEWYVGLSPRRPEDARQDPDDDGLTAYDEFFSFNTSTNVQANRFFVPGWQNKSHPCDPFDPDTDWDQVLDGGERAAFNFTGGLGTPVSKINSNTSAIVYVHYVGGGLNPTTIDTDGDHIPDAWETVYAGNTDPATGAITGGADGTQDDRFGDPDGDGVLNYQEYFAGAVYHWQIWYNNGAPAWRAGRGLYNYEPYDFFNEQMSAGGQWFVGPGGRKPKYWDPFCIIGPPYHPVPFKFITAAEHPTGLWFSSMDPCNFDTDADGMDDFWESYHALNPLFGTVDIVASKVAGAVIGVPTILPHFIWFGDPDIHKYPWIAGHLFLDPDQDELPNIFESVQPNVATPEYYHSDPSPMWMTDTSSDQSWVNLYYWVGNVFGNPLDPHWFWDELVLALLDTYPSYVYSFEINEGYDTDNDMIADRAEIVHDPSSPGVTDWQDGQKPIKRRAMHMNGDAACRTLTSYTHPPTEFREFTLELWVNAQNPAKGEQQILMERGAWLWEGNPLGAPAGFRANFRIGLDEDGRLFGGYHGAGMNYIFYEVKAPTTAPLASNRWYHVAVTFDGQYMTGGHWQGMLKLYRDGQLIAATPTSEIPFNGWYGGLGSLAPTGYISGMPITVGAGDLNPNGWIDGSPILVGPLMGLTHAPPQLHSFFEGWVDQVQVWDRARKADEIRATMMKRYERPEVATLVTYGTPPGMTNATPAAIRYMFTFDDMNDPDNSPIAPDGFDLLNGRPSVYSAIPWWGTAPDRSRVYSDYRYIPWVENLAGHAAEDPPRDTPIGQASAGNRYPNQTNPYTFVYRTGSRFSQETHPHAVVQPTSTAPANYIDMLPLRWAEADENVEMWDSAETIARTGMDLYDTDGDGLPDSWEEYFGLDPLSTNGVQGATGDPDEDGLTNYEEWLSGTNPFSVDSDGDGFDDSMGDADGDGLSNMDELHVFMTLPYDADSDDDGYLDGVEVRNFLPSSPDNYGVANAMTAPAYSLSPRINRSLSLAGHGLVAPFGERFRFLAGGPTGRGPVVTITAPPDGSSSAVRFITVSGTVTSAQPIASVKLYNNNQFVMNLTLDANGGFSETIIIGAGANEIKAVAIDVDGQVGDDTVTVTGTFALADIRVTQTWDSPGDLDTWLVDPLGRHMGWTTGGPGFPNNIAQQIPGSDLDIDDVAGTGPENITVERGFATNGNYEVWMNNYSHSGNPNSTVRVLVHEGAPNQQYVEFGPQPMPTSDFNGTNPDAWWHVTTINWPSGNMTPAGRPVGGAPTDDTDDTQTGIASLIGWTIEMWVKPMDARQTGAITRYTHPNGMMLFEIGLYNNMPFARMRASSGGIYQVDSAPLRAGEWTHIAVVYSLNEHSLRLHIDGMLVDAQLMPETRNDLGGILTVDDTWLPPGAQVPSVFTNCFVDEMRFWNRARNGGLIFANMHRIVYNSPTLVACYRFDDGGEGIEDATRPLNRGYDLGDPPDALVNAAPGRDGIWGTADDVTMALGADGHNDYVTAAEYALVFGDVDIDEDGLPKWWEEFHFGVGQPGSETTYGPTDDPDQDGLNNLYEFLVGGNPMDQDADDDGVLDRSEDPDRDGVPSGEEMLIGSHPMLRDTDDDGLSDAAEAEQGFSPVDALSPWVDRVLSVNGSQDSYVLLPKQPRFLLENWTVEAWIKPQSVSNEGTIVSYEVGNGLYTYYMGINTQQQVVVGFSSGDHTTNVMIRTPALGSDTRVRDIVPLRSWSHVAASFAKDTGLLSLFVDGDLVAAKMTGYRPAVDAEGPVRGVIGRGFNGMIDEVRISSYAMVGWTFNATNITTATIVADYAFDDGTSYRPNVATTGTSGAHWIRHGQVQDFAPSVGDDWWNLWIHAGTLVGAAEMKVAPPDAPLNNSRVDSDEDNLPDWWEWEYFNGLTTASTNASPGGYTDSDRDGLNDYYEYLLRLNPTLFDSDGDGVSDGNEDPDGDGLPNGEEQLWRTDPLSADTDDDGKTDFAEVKARGMPSSPRYSMSGSIPRSLNLARVPVEGLSVPAEQRFNLMRYLAAQAAEEQGTDPAGGTGGTGVVTEEEEESGSGGPVIGWVVEGWIRTEVAGQTGEVISHVIGGLKQFALGVNGGVPYAAFHDRFGTLCGVSDVEPLALGRWTHLAAVWDPVGHTFTLLVNGTKGIQLEFDASMAPVAGVGDVFIGRSTAGWTRTWIDEVRVWDRMRSQNEIDRGRFQRVLAGTRNLVACYRFDDGGRAIEDFSHPYPAEDAGVYAIHSEDYPGVQVVDGTADWVDASQAVRMLGYDDSDGDRLPDWFEDLFGTDPLLADTDGNEVMDGDEDPDADGIRNYYEYLGNARPDHPRTYGDLDEGLDTDEGVGDGVKLLFEQTYGCDPRYKDTDEDGVDDDVEIMGPRASRRDVAFWPISDPASSLDPVVRRGLVLNGTSRVVVPPQAKYALRQWTIEAYVKPDATHVGNAVIFRRAVERIGQSDEKLNYELGLLADNGALRPYVQFGRRNFPVRAYNPSASVPRGVWTHIGATLNVDPHEMTLYVDGRPVAVLGADQLVGREPPVMGTSVGEVTIGGATGPGGAPTMLLKGAVDEVRVWSSINDADAVYANFRTIVEPNALVAAQQPTNAAGPGPGGAFTITPNTDPTQLFQALLGGNALPSGITDVNASYIGTGASAAGSGTFSGFPLLPTSAPLADGIVIASGTATDALGPNSAAGITTVLGTPGDADLAAIANMALNQSYDAIGIIVTFKSDNTVDSLSFDMVFGSDEFPEFVGTSFNDAFGAFLDGVNVTFDDNGNPLTVNNNFFQLDNDPWNPTDPDAIGKLPVDVNCEYDGLTPVLRTTWSLGEGTHALKFVICDFGDQILDSGIFLSNLKFGGSVVERGDLIAYFRMDDGGAILQDHAELDLRWGIDVAGAPLATAPGAAVSGANGDAAELLGDTDGDGTPDWWEQGHGFNRFDADDGATDVDNDDLDNRAEFLAGTHPRRPDADFDGTTDDREDKEDGTGDGVAAWREAAIGSAGGNWLYPEMRDTDDDGVNDGAEIAAQTLPGDSLSPLVARALRVGGNTNDYMLLPNQTRFHLAESWTVEAWIWPEGADGIILQRESRTQRGVAAVNYELGLKAGRVYARYVDYYGYPREIRSAGRVDAGARRWRHVAAVYNQDTGTFQLYVNGVLEATTIDGGAHPGAVAIGATRTVVGLGFRGLIDELKLWDYPLELNELNFFNNGALAGVEEGLVAYYRFDDGGRWAEDFVVASMLDWRTHWWNAGRLMGQARMEAVADAAVDGPGLDSDVDGVPDWWEVRHFGDIGTADAVSDADADGVSDLYEYLTGLNPLMVSTFMDDVADGNRDTDGDGLVNAFEQQRGTLPSAADTDDDGLTDREEITNVDDGRPEWPERPSRLSNPLRSLDPPRQRSLYVDGTARMVVRAQDRHALTDWTIEAWVKPDAGGDGGVIIRRATRDLLNGVEAVNYELGVRRVTVGGETEFWPYVRYVGITNGAPLEVRIDGEQPAEVNASRAPNSRLGPLALNRGDWTHLAATYSAQDHLLSLYVDTRLAAYRLDAIELPQLGAAANAELGSELTVGGGGLNAAGAVQDGFEGYIDDVRIAGGAASEQTIVNDAAGISPLTRALEIASKPRTNSFRVPTVAEALAAPHRAGELLVRFRSEVRTAQAADIASQLGARLAKSHRLVPVHRVQITDGQSLADKLARFRADPNVLYAEPNYRLHALGVPNDPNFADLWGMNNEGQTGGTEDADIDAVEAWDVNTGSDNIIVAVIDTGVDYTHPDLADNIWTNPGEIPNNGVDDDGNGYVDDVHGYDFFDNDGDPQDTDGHGTHVSGTIGAVGNNGIGVAGVNWKAKIMALRFLGPFGGFTDDAIECIEYAVQMGANLSNNSWGGGGYSQALYDAIAAARDANQLFVAAAGNDGTDNDAVPAYPASYDLDNIIAVAATDHNDLKADFSNFGAVSVDLGAPGVDILSSVPGGQYQSNNGTSMASPHVAGACALLLSSSPGLTYEAVKQIVLDGADPVDDLEGKCLTGARLNIGNIIRASAAGGATVAYFNFDDGGATAEDFTVANDWLSGWSHAGVLQNARFSADEWVQVFGDADGDSLPDWWENAMGLDPNDATGDNGADGDPDLDGVRNLYEYLGGTYARAADTDTDGEPDYYEDPDHDNVATGHEQDLYRTNPGEADTDDDGIEDGDELSAGSDPTDSLSPFVARALEFTGGTGDDNLVIAPDRIDGVDTDRFSSPVWTIEAVVNPAALSGPGQMQAFLSRRAKVSGRLNYELGMTNGLPYVRFDEAEYGHAIMVVSGLPLRTNTWTHLAGRFNEDGQLALFVDGELASTRRVLSECSVGAGDLVLGSRGFRGRLVMTRVWRIAQSDAEIRGIVRQSLFQGSVGSMSGYLRVSGNGHLKENAVTIGPSGATIDQLTGEWTLEAWVRTTGAGTVICRRNGSAATTDDFNYYLGVQAGGSLIGRFAVEYTVFIPGPPTVIYTAVDFNVNDIVGEMTVNDGAWHHVAYVRDANRCYLYVDGMLDAVQESLLVPTPPAGIVIGAGVRALEGPVVIGETLSGDIDESRIWDRGLPGWELRDVNGRNLSGNERGLVSYFNFDYQLRDVADDRAARRDPLEEYGVYVGDARRVAGATDGPPIVYDPLLPVQGVALSAYFAAVDGGDTLEDFMNRMGVEPFTFEKFAGRRADGVSLDPAVNLGAGVHFVTLPGSDWPEMSDSDGDGLSDAWESEHGLDPGIAQGDDGPYGDPDHDGLINLYEYLAFVDYGLKLDPLSFGTFSTNVLSDFFAVPGPGLPEIGVIYEDTDELPDGWEATSPRHLSRLYYNRDEDPDSDGYSNFEEYLGGSSPILGDSVPTWMIRGRIVYAGNKPGTYHVLAYPTASMDRGGVACDVQELPDGTVEFSSTNVPGGAVYLFAWKGDDTFAPTDPYGLPRSRPVRMWWGSAMDVEIGLTDPEEMPWFQPFQWPAVAEDSDLFVRITRMGGSSAVVLTTWMHGERNWFHQADYLRATVVSGGDYSYGLPPATYSWQVATSEATDPAAVVAEGMFSVPAYTAPRCRPVLPYDGDIVRHTRFGFKWSVPVNTRAPRFELQVFRGRTTTDMIWSANVPAPWKDENDTYTLRLPVPGAGTDLFGIGAWTNGNYTWRVRAWNNSTPGLWPLTNGTFQVGIEDPPPMGQGAPGIYGNIAYHGRASTSNLIVRAFLADGSRAEADAEVRMNRPGAFRLLGLEQDEYVLMAFIDVNGNNKADAWEPQGFARDPAFGNHYEYRADAFGVGRVDLSSGTRAIDVRILVRDRDTDNDNLPDGWEYRLHGSPNTLHYNGTDDNDGDGVSNMAEYGYGTDPMNADTDGDGLRDGDEVNVHRSSPISVDGDGDGLRDDVELAMGLNPMDPDDDGDGVPTAAEIAWDGAAGYNAAGDMNPGRRDTDGDSVDDLAELAAGSDPCNPADAQQVTIAGIGLNAGGGAAVTWPVFQNRRSVDILYVVESSTDLVNWLPVGQVLSGGDADGVAQVNDAATPAGRRYYRLRVVAP